MNNQADSWVRDIYWYEVIKRILSENKQPLSTIELWQRMRDNYAYSHNLDRVEKDLWNLQRSGSVVSVTKRGKQAWMSPTGMKSLITEKNKEIDYAISEIIEASNRMPTIKEIITKLNEPVSQRQASKRLAKISKLTNSVDNIIKKMCQQKATDIPLNKKQSQESESFCTTDKQGMQFYDTIINELNGTIEDIDILTIITIIDARKKFIY